MDRVRKFWLAMLLVFSIAALAAQAAQASKDDQQSSSDGRIESFSDELKREAKAHGRAGIDRVMRKHGWRPLVNEAESSLTTDSVPATSLTMEPMYAYAHDRNLQLAVYQEWDWSSFEDSDHYGSYDVLGIDWEDSRLNWYGSGSPDDFYVWPSSRSLENQVVNFNAKDFIYNADNSMAWIVMDIPLEVNEEYLYFGSKYEHTYTTVTETTTWGASIHYEEGITGSASWSVVLSEEEASWTKMPNNAGKFWWDPI